MGVCTKERKGVTAAVLGHSLPQLGGKDLSIGWEIAGKHRSTFPSMKSKGEGGGERKQRDTQATSGSSELKRVCAGTPEVNGGARLDLKARFEDDCHVLLHSVHAHVVFMSLYDSAGSSKRSRGGNAVVTSKPAAASRTAVLSRRSAQSQRRK